MTVLVHNQYAQALDVPSILRSGPVWAAFPLLMCIIYPVHYLKAEAATAYTDALVELGLLVLSLVVGAQLVGVVSDRPYLAVMKRAPALGTVWVWTVVEVSWFTGVVGLLGVAGWAWKRGHWA
ncbi:MAG: hypothetical protein M1816_004744 [Peltula sp. TS41687]|nr:MAG: hypothetical protein M1816_004744 [Peltula sp. TS41687]